MSSAQLTAAVAPGYVDPRRNLSGSDFYTRIFDNNYAFAANGAGSTTTIVGANADPATGDNVIRLGEQFVLVDANGDLKENTVFTADTIAVGASTTVTFSPTAAEATTGTDEARIVGISRQDSVADIDARLLELGFSQVHIDSLTLNDKQYQLRVSDDPGSV